MEEWKIKTLSPTQLRISGLLAEGNQPQDIARLLKTKPQNVRQQISAILKKLGLRSSLGIASWYWKTHKSSQKSQ